MIINATNASTAAATIDNLTTALKYLEIEMPAKVATALAKFEYLDTGVQAPDPRDIAEAVAKALEAGKEPAADKAVQTLLTRERLADPKLTGRLRAQAVKGRVAALVDGTDEILAALATVVDNASEVIQADAERNTVDANRNARFPVKAELDRLARVVQVWQALGELANVKRQPTDAPLVLVEPTGEDITNGKRDALDPARKARPLSLATFETYTERVKARDALRMRERDRLANERRAALSRSIGSFTGA